jgi:Zn-dependent M28 family amino/carboxypeptidase
LALVSCQPPAPEAPNPTFDQAFFEQTLKTLSSDEFQGRKPFSEGETKTIAFLEKELKALGLQPGNGGSYQQEVPMMELDGTPAPTMEITGAASPISLKNGEDYTITSPINKELVSVENAEIVFCGYGIVAPENNWNDYAGVDMKGKIAMVLVNDPGYATEDSTFFKGKTMTYYGRWTYKFEEAARQGAAGVLVIHETGAAGYPWFVPRRGNESPALYLEAEGENAYKCDIEGWITYKAAAELIKASPVKTERLYEQAKTPGFKPVPLGLMANTSIQNKAKTDKSANIIAVLPGTTRPDEYILYCAHWDHLGIGPEIDGDSIYNGALDNASGSAFVLTTAKAFTELKQKPERSIVFLFVTAEEQGLLGSAWYAAHPVFPHSKTVAALNVDGVNKNGLMKDMTVTGYGQSELEDIAAKTLATQDRYLLPEQEPEKGFFFRSDHFNFAKAGVPALYAKGGYDHREKGKEYAMEKKEDFTKNDYHRPSDEYRTEDWDFAGVAQDMEVYFQVAWQLANSTDFPKWKEGSEFKAIRESVNTD